MTVLVSQLRTSTQFRIAVPVYQNHQADEQGVCACGEPKCRRQEQAAKTITAAGASPAEFAGRRPNT